MDIFNFSAQVDVAPVGGDTGEMSARIVPFGESVPYGSTQIRFERGGLETPGNVPLTIDHGDSVMDRIGIMGRFSEGDDGAYATFSFADTQTAQDVRALLAAGAVTDVSVGVADFSVDDGVMTGRLDHVSVVPHGRFGETAAPSQVLSVHDREEPPVADETMEAAPVVATYDDSEIRQDVAKMEAQLVDLAEAFQGRDDVKPSEQFSASDVMTYLMTKNSKASGLVAEHALADVIGDLGAADASGLYYDEYWGAGIQHLLDQRRPLFSTGGAAPFPSTGENLVVPRVTQSTSVAPHSAEKAAVASQALQVDKFSFPTVWFTGAVDVAIELIEQGYSVMPTIMDDLMTQYAIATETDATTKLQAAATHTGAALDTSSYGALVTDLITTSNLIEDTTGRPGDICGVTSAQWIAINSLLDSDGRRVLATINPRNADGTASLVTRGVDISGVFVYRAPQAATALQYNARTYQNGEKSPMQVASTNVELFGRDVGIGGATVNVFWPTGVYSYEI